MAIVLRILVTFHNTLEIILTNPNHPQCYETQYNYLNSQSTSCPTPTKHQTHVGNSSSTSKSSCLSLGQLGLHDEPWIEHRSCARALFPLGHLGITTPTRHPGHPSPYQYLGSKPDLSPHRNPDSVLHIVIVPCCCSFRP